MPFSQVNIGTNTGASGTTLAITIPAGGVPPGALIIVAVTEKSTSGVNGTLADTAGNTWNTSQSGSLAATAANGRGMVFFAFASKALASGNTITYTRNLSASSCSMSACYFGGMRTDANPEDTAARATANGTTGTITVTSGTPANAGDLFVGVLCDSGTSVAGGNATFTQATNWATPPNEATTGGSAGSRVNGGWRQQSGAPATFVYNPTLSSTAQQWIIFITAFQATADITERFAYIKRATPQGEPQFWQGAPVGTPILMTVQPPLNFQRQAPTTLGILDPDVKPWQRLPVSVPLAIMSIPPPADLSSYVSRAPRYVPKPPFVPDWPAAPIESNFLLLGGLGARKQLRANYMVAVEPYWQGQPDPAIPLPIFGVIKPLNKQSWRYDYQVEQPLWAGSPIAAGIFTIPQTLPRALFYAPRPEWDKEWVGKPQASKLIYQVNVPPFTVGQQPWGFRYPPAEWVGVPQGSDAIMMLTAGGKPFFQQWRYDFEADKYWLGTPESSQSLVIPKPQPTNKQLWRYDFDVEAPNRWQGEPSPAQTLLDLANTPFSKQWRYDFVPDSYWQGAPVQTNIEFFPFIKPFGKQWRYDFVPSTDWLGTPINSETLITPPAAPFGKQWHYDLEADKYWQGSPVGYVTIPSAEPFSKQWRYDFEADKHWQRYSLPAISLNMLVEGGVPTFKQWRYDLVPDPYWQGAPQPTNIEFFPFVKPVFKLWRYDLITDTWWQGTPTYNQTPQSAVTPFSNRWASQTTWDSDIHLWQWKAPSSQTLYSLVEGGAPFSKQWRYDWNMEYPQWVGAPIGSESIYLTPIEPPSVEWYSQTTWDSDIRLWVPKSQPPRTLYALVEGGAPFFKQWRYDLEFDKFWQGAPIQTNIEFIPLVVPFSNEWFSTSTWDSDTRLWQWKAPGSQTLSSLIEGGKPFFKQWRYDYEPDKYWQGSPIQTNIEFFPFVKPFLNVWTSLYTFEPDKLWQGTPLIDWTIRTPQVNPFTNEWSATYTWDADVRLWQGKPVPTNIQTLAPVLPFSNEWYDQYAYVPEPFWLGTPQPTKTLVALLQPKMYGAPGQAPTKQWRYDYSSGETYWVGEPQPTNPFTFPEPFSNEWSSTYTFEPDKFWQGAPQLAHSIVTPQTEPFSNPRRFDSTYDYSSGATDYWLGRPLRTQTLVDLARHPTSPQKFWRYDADFNTWWQGSPVPYPTSFIRVSLAIFNPDFLLPSHPKHPRRKDPLAWMGDDLRKSPIPDDPLHPRRKDPLK